MNGRVLLFLGIIAATAHAQDGKYNNGAVKHSPGRYYVQTATSSNITGNQNSDSGSEIVGWVDSQGRVVNGNQAIGRVLGDGKNSVVNGNSKVMGFVVPRDWDPVFDSDGKLIGALSEDDKFMTYKRNVIDLKQIDKKRRDIVLYNVLMLRAVGVNGEGVFSQVCSSEVKTERSFAITDSYSIADRTVESGEHSNKARVLPNDKSSIHNHPQTSAWPSLMDVISYIRDPDRYHYIYSCAERKVNRFDVDSGRVLKIESADIMFGVDSGDVTYPHSDSEKSKWNEKIMAIATESDKNTAKRQLYELWRYAAYDENSFKHSAYIPETFRYLKILVQKYPDVFDGSWNGGEPSTDVKKAKSFASANQPKLPKDSAKEQKTVVAETQSQGEAVGVRGWCKCNANGGHSEFVGQGLLFEENAPKDAPKVEGDFIYIVCNKCGLCERNRQIGGDGPVRKCHIIDMRVCRKYGDQKGKTITPKQYEELLLEADRKLLAIPDGQIVVPGKCVCTKPDPTSVGLYTDKFYVCIICGRVRLPDDNGKMPIGPTMKRNMGL